MPRKKATPKDEESVSAPKRTRRTAPKRVAKAANAPAVERPRILSSEEKRKLILAHAAERQPVDAVQRFSLWTGVIVCVLAITIGWVYTMRQTIASAIHLESKNEQMDYQDIKASMHDNFAEMVEQIDNIQEEQIQDLQLQAELIKQNNAALATSTESTTSTVTNSTEGRADLFQPTDKTNNPSNDNFELPRGVSIDTLNN